MATTGSLSVCIDFNCRVDIENNGRVAAFGASGFRGIRGDASQGSRGKGLSALPGTNQIDSRDMGLPPQNHSQRKSIRSQSESVARPD